MTEENTARVERQKKTPITVIIGNPPYNVGQLNENDNNKNRKYKVIDWQVARHVRLGLDGDEQERPLGRVRQVLPLGDRPPPGPGRHRLLRQQQRLPPGYCLRRLSQAPGQEFDLIYHFNFRGNGRRLGIQRTLEGRNIFSDQIRVGVGVTMLVRHGRKGPARVFYHAVADRMKAREKKQYLRTFRSLSDVPWRRIDPRQTPHLARPENAAEYSEMISIGSKGGKSGLDEETIFKTFSVGVNSARDGVVYDFDLDVLALRVKTFIDNYNAEVDRFAREGEDVAVDDFVRYEKVKWSRDLKLDLQRRHYARFDAAKIRVALYRPFCKLHLFFDRILNEEVYVFPKIFPTPETERENRVIVISDIGYRAFSFAVLMANCITNLHLCASSDSHQCFPFFAGLTHQPGASGCSGEERLAAIVQSGWLGIGHLLYHRSPG